MTRKNENGDIDRFYNDDVGPLADARGMRKTYGLNQERTHVLFQFHDKEDLPKVVLFKLKWGRK